MYDYFSNLYIYWTQIACLLNTIYNCWVLFVYTIYWEQSVCLLGTVCYSVGYSLCIQYFWYNLYVCQVQVVYCCIYSILDLLGTVCLSVEYSLYKQSIGYNVNVCQVQAVYTFCCVQYVRSYVGTVCIYSLFVCKVQSILVVCLVGTVCIYSILSTVCLSAGYSLYFTAQYVYMLFTICKPLYKQCPCDEFIQRYHNCYSIYNELFLKQNFECFTH